MLFRSEGETIIWKGVDNIDLSAIKAGEEVEVGYYTGEDNEYIASWIDLLANTEDIQIKKILEKDE